MMGLLQRSWIVTLILGPIWILSYTYDFGTCNAFDKHDFPNERIEYRHRTCMVMSFAGPLAIPAFALLSGANAYGWTLD